MPRVSNWPFLFITSFWELHLLALINSTGLKICFLHPDLGLGGAEKLVVETAVLLKSAGHDVHIVTCRHDPNRCFPATADGTVPPSRHCHAPTNSSSFFRFPF